MEVTDQVINKLFWVMRNQYGGSWGMLFDKPGELADGKALWKSKLRRFNANNIAKTLEHVKEIHPTTPPDIEQFVKLLKHLKGHRAGHLSNHLWESPVSTKTTNKGFREKIKEEFGV